MFRYNDKGRSNREFAYRKHNIKYITDDGGNEKVYETDK